MEPSERAAVLEQRIRDELGAVHVAVEDESHLHAGHPGAASGAGHFRVLVVSDRFAGLSRVAAQRLVYGAVDDLMGPEIHALSLKTMSPEEWSDSQS